MSGALFCIVFIAYMLFGVLFYELRVFTYIDEVMAILIAVYASWQMFTRRVAVNKPFIIWLVISFFYLIYSFVIRSNVPQAIVSDFEMQSKPYLVFFGLMCVQPKLTKRHFNILQTACWLFVALVVFIYIEHPDDRAVATSGVLLTGEALSALTILLGILFYICSDSNKLSTKLTTLAIMGLGVLSATSKFWATFVCAAAVLLFVNKPIKFNIKYLCIGAVAAVAIFLLVKDEFIFYFIEDFEYSTRPMLYIKMWDILADYIPFGSGFGTYACPASMTWYSPLYSKYDMDAIWGLEDGGEISFASDAYYPLFAQFGYVGIVLFVCFIVYLFWRMNRLFALTQDIKRYRVSLMIVCYILIQATSNALANERSVIAMAILVLSLYKYANTTRSAPPNSLLTDSYNQPINSKADEGTTNK